MSLVFKKSARTQVRTTRKKSFSKRGEKKIIWKLSCHDRLEKKTAADLEINLIVKHEEGQMNFALQCGFVMMIGHSRSARQIAGCKENEPE